MTEQSAVARQPDWPDAALVGLGPVRMLALPGPANAPEEDHWWSLAASSDHNGHLLITAELTQFIGSWFFSVTTVARIQFAGTLPPMNTDEEYDGAVTKYGSWVAHPLWDYSRALFMQMAGPFLTRSLEVPALTPEPLYVTAEVRRARRERVRGADEDTEDE